jgi:hypothetical protein
VFNGSCAHGCYNPTSPFSSDQRRSQAKHSWHRDRVPHWTPHPSLQPQPAAQGTITNLRHPQLSARLSATLGSLQLGPASSSAYSPGQHSIGTCSRKLVEPAHFHQAPVAHTCNLNYLGGRDQEDHS